MFATIGCADQITVLKHLDPDVLRENPTRFFGGSDNTCLTSYLWACGVVSYYGGSLLSDIATPGNLPEYTERYLRRALFDETVAELDRDPYLADKSVTPFPLEGWSYADPGDDFESDDWDGVRLVCGAAVEGLKWSYPPDEGGEEDGDADGDEPGCDEAFYLNFVRFEDGREVEGEPESEHVRLAETRGPQSPSSPGGPPGPGFSR